MTPTSAKTGTKFPQQQPIRSGRNESGIYTDVPFETTSDSEANKLLLQAAVSGVLFDYEQSFGKHKITYHFPYSYATGTPANEPPTDLWEMNSQKTQKSILDSANPLANACSQGEIFLLGLFVQNKSDYIIVPDNDSTAPTTQTGRIAYYDTTYDAGQSSQKRLSIAAGSAARTLADVIAMGQDSFDVFVPQLKHTKTVNSAYPIRPRNVNVGSIISTPTMYATENIPNNVLFDLPDYIDPAPASGKPVLSWGWYKDSPAVNQIARLKFQIVETWTYGLWPVAVYGTPL